MKYPTIDSINALKVLDSRSSLANAHNPNSFDDIDSNYIEWLGNGECLDIQKFALLSNFIDSQMSTNNLRDKDRAEGRVAEKVYNLISEIPVSEEALNSSGFWTYLSLTTFYNFTIWRENSAFEKYSSTGKNDYFKKFIDGKNYRYCVPRRMYVRVSSLGGEGYSDLAYLLENATYLWHRIILSRKIAYYPYIVRTVIKFQNNDSKRISNSDLDIFIAKITRTITNILPEFLNEEESIALVEEHWIKT